MNYVKNLCLIMLLSSLLASVQAQQLDVQAHRGGMGLLTENTLEAFANAIALGVTTLEMDTQVTADGFVIVTHDRQVLDHRCRDTQPAVADDPDFPYVGKFIKSLTLAQIQTLDCGSQRAAAHPEQRTLPGSQLVQLAEVLALVKRAAADSVMLNIETKIEAGAPEQTVALEPFVQAVLREIRAAEMLDRVTIQSFDWGALMRVRELEPSLPIIALSNAQSFLQCGMPGASPWTGGIDMDDFECSLPSAAASFGADAISPVHGLPQEARVTDAGYLLFTTSEMVEQAHALGMKVIPWTIDDAASLEFFVELGVDGIITNYPERLLNLLRSR